MNNRTNLKVTYSCTSHFQLIFILIWKSSKMNNVKKKLDKKIFSSSVIAVYQFLMRYTTLSLRDFLPNFWCTAFMMIRSLKTLGKSFSCQLNYTVTCQISNEIISPQIYRCTYWSLSDGFLKFFLGKIRNANKIIWYLSSDTK